MVNRMSCIFCHDRNNSRSFQHLRHLNVVYFIFSFEFEIFLVLGMKRYFGLYLGHFEYSVMRLPLAPI